MKKIGLFFSLMIMFHACDSRSGKINYKVLIIDFIVTADKDYTNWDSYSDWIIFRDSVPFGTTEATIKKITLTGGNTDKKAGDKLKVGTPNIIVLTREDGHSENRTVTIYSKKE